ncbi:MAG: transketolase family protein [Candidatus Nomurabacteria bacterium]|jgi:transketolase|nr:transketolase family protein [Candidatus Nomurabacteria bacterium]
MAKSTLREIRHGFADGLLEAARADSNVYVLSADLSSSLGFDKIAAELPNQYVEVGVAEQNMICVASGLAHMGKTAFAGSYSMFSPCRNWEQIRTTVCLNRQPVKIISSHSGFSDASDGATHQALEDIALARVLPELVVLSPADYAEARAMAPALAKDRRPTYVRMQRGKFPDIFPDGIEFKIGPARHIRDGKDVVIFTTGSMASTVLDAAEILEKSKISAAVVHFPTIKPLDEKTVREMASKYGRIITVEEHQIAGGFGSAIAETIAEKQLARLCRIGVRDSFGESGSYEELLKKHGLDTKSIVAQIKKFMLE